MTISFTIKVNKGVKNETEEGEKIRKLSVILGLAMVLSYMSSRAFAQPVLPDPM